MFKTTYVINGGFPIIGNIQCMGAKNLTTKLMIASLISKRQTILYNVPNNEDIEITRRLLISIGIKIKWEKGKNQMLLDPKIITHSKICWNDLRSNRSSILFLSVLIHRIGEATVPTAGGDAIGQRNVNYHIKALRMFGALVTKKNNQYMAKRMKRLKSCNMILPYPSVGATENCILLSVLAQGVTIIQNIAIEPEIIELINMLRSMGAKIFISHVRELTIYGNIALKGTRFYILGDRIEAASWACLACATNGRVEIKGMRMNLLSNFLPYFNHIGGGFQSIHNNSIVFFQIKKLTPVKLETNTFPRFSTDYQQPFTMLLTQGNGTSSIHETVYEKRLSHLLTLRKLGGNIKLLERCIGKVKCRYYKMGHIHSSIINGPSKVNILNDKIVVPDIRAGLAYLIAAVLSNGKTILKAGEHIERGYGDLETKLFCTNILLQRITEVMQK